MPNIMLTYRCNLACPYCFANEFVNCTDCDITEEDFSRALDFMVEKPGTGIGLIGGEPTIHPKLEQFVRIAAANPNIEDIMVYTNGLELERLLPLCQDPVIGGMLKILVNCNSPKVMGQSNYSRLKNSLDAAFGTYHAGRNIKLGLNLYSNDFDYSFIKELLMRYNQYQLRISLTVPDFAVCGQVDAVENFKSRKEYLLQFFREMDEIGVIPYYDCNRPPRCIWTDEEWGWICWYRNKYRSFGSNIADLVSQCHPIVDILPDLRAVRCFGMSDFEKVRIDDFDCLSDLQNYFRNRVDAEAYRISSGAECIGCYDKMTGRCSGGCLGYKSKKIEKINQFVSEIIEGN